MRAPDDALFGSIGELMAEEPFAVLCTQGGGQPYGSIVAFAFADDLTALCFATPADTRKYRLLSECDRVAMVVDNRDRFPGEIMKTRAVTITGRAVEAPPGADFDRWAGLLAARHPYLQAFVEDPSTALFVIQAARYVYVARFQEVREWVPGQGW
jgi:hypothetical protein